MANSSRVEPKRTLVDYEGLAVALKQAPEFAGRSPGELAHIAAVATEVHFQAGDQLFRAGEAADWAYYLSSGSVYLGDANGETVAVGFIGQEAGIDIGTYLRDATALDRVCTYAIPRSALIPHEPRTGGTSFWHHLVGSLSGRPLEPEPVTKKDDGGAQADQPGRFLGWSLAVVVPIILLVWGRSSGFTWHQQQFLALLGICLVMLSFHLVPQYAAVLMTALGCLVLGVVPPRVVLSGFASDGFFMALSIFGLGSVLVRSGIAVRLVLNLLKFTTVSSFWYNFNFLVLGILMTPCLPSANARVGLLTPLLTEVSQALGFQNRQQQATRLLFSMFVGCTLFAPIFLTSKSLNFIVYDLLPTQVSQEYQWLRWLAAAAFPGLLMLLLYLLVSSLFFRGGPKPHLSAPHLLAQLRLLGPLRPQEWIAVLGSLAFIAAIISYSIHKISPAWIALGTFWAFLTLGSLKKKHLREGFDWGALLMIGFFIGLEDTMNVVGLGSILKAQLSGITHYMVTNFELFVLMLLGIISIMRLFLPITTTGVLVASVILPMANLKGVNPWVVGFVIITLSELWWMPAQSSYFLTFEETAGSKPAHDHRLFLKLNALSMAIRLLVLFVSLPFFRLMEVL